MTEQKNTPAAATARGTHETTNELQNYYNNTVDGLQARIVDKLNRITDIHALNRIYDCVHRQEWGHERAFQTPPNVKPPPHVGIPKR